MRWTVFLGIAALAGCSTDTSGLGGDIVVADATTDDTNVSGDETSPLFDADEDGAMPPDTEMPVDSGVVPDTELPDTTMLDTEVPDVPDTFVPDTSTGDAGDAVVPIDVMPVDGSVTPTPGRVVCSEGGMDVTCATDQVCCKTSSGFKCADSCGTFGLGGYKCDEKADCPGGQVCCADITPFVGTWNGSYCALNGTCFTAELCSRNSDCSGGKVCTPIKPSGVPYTMGYCK